MVPQAPMELPQAEADLRHTPVMMGKGSGKDESETQGGGVRIKVRVRVRVRGGRCLTDGSTPPYNGGLGESRRSDEAAPEFPAASSSSLAFCKQHTLSIGTLTSCLN